MVSVKDKKEYITKLIISFVLCLLISITVSFVITSGLLSNHSLSDSINYLRKWIFFYRAYLLTLALYFISFHFIFPIKKMYEFFWKHRWLIGILLLIFLTINRLNGDSLTFYTDVIQPDKMNELGYPIFGKYRSIRSDEFLVGTPQLLSSLFGKSAFGKYSYLMRGAKTIAVGSGIYLGFSTLAVAPWKLAFAVLPAEMAYSFCWYFTPIFAFLFSMELYYIITKNKSVSFVGSCLTILSSYYLWWGFSTYFLSCPGVIVSLYYFIKSDSKLKKVLLALVTALCFSCFVCNLYPAWQVPIGFIYLVIGIWLIYSNWNEIKDFSKFEWGTLIVAIVFAFALIGSYLYDIREYMAVINETVYPGKRVENGGYFLYKLFLYSQCMYYPYKDFFNPSEFGVFYTLFPLPLLLAIYISICTKFKDILLDGLLLIQIPMLFYITIGLPPLLAKLLLFTYSTPTRMADIVGYIQVIILVIVFAKYSKYLSFNKIFAAAISIVVSIMAISASKNNFDGYLSLKLMIISFGFIFLSCYFLLRSKKKILHRTLCLLLVLVSFLTSVMIRPIMVGLSAIYHKPLAKEVMEITKDDPNGKWLAVGGIWAPSYILACGAPTLNSVNTYPNLDLWHKLDPNNEYEEVYNRYAHVNVVFSCEDTRFDLLSPDSMQLTLSYKDLKKTKAKYIYINGDFELDYQNGYVNFTKIYDESNAKIFRIDYLQ